MRPPQHRPLLTAPPASADVVRGNRHQRGYGNDHVAWRMQVLMAHPCCRRCELAGHTTESTIAHHLIELKARPDLRLMIDNGVGVCVDCHNHLHKVAGEVQRFAKQMAARGYGISTPTAGNK